MLFNTGKAPFLNNFSPGTNKCNRTHENFERGNKSVENYTSVSKHILIELSCCNFSIYTHQVNSKFTT